MTIDKTYGERKRKKLFFFSFSSSLYYPLINTVFWNYKLSILIHWFLHWGLGLVSFWLTWEWIWKSYASPTWMLAENVQDHLVQIITTESFFWGETKNLKKIFFFPFAVVISKTVWTFKNILNTICYWIYIGNVKFNCDMKQNFYSGRCFPIRKCISEQSHIVVPIKVAIYHC